MYQPAKHLLVEFSPSAEITAVIKSKVFHSTSISEDTELVDYALTMTDVGLSNNIPEGRELFGIEDRYMSLEAVIFNPYLEVLDPIGLAPANEVPSYKIDNAFWSGFFKLQGYDYQIMPYRYTHGLTIETSFQKPIATTLTDDASFFLFMGARAENKFAKLHQGNLNLESQQTHLPLGPDHAIDAEKSMGGNAAGFFLTPDLTIGYRYLNNNAEPVDFISTNRLSDDGKWKVFAAVYVPCEVISDDPELLDCLPQRLGKMLFYVNGLLFHEQNNVPELHMQPLFTSPEKQIGVPFTLSWGGGSLGLAFATVAGQITTDFQNLTIQKNFHSILRGCNLHHLRIYERPFDFVGIRSIYADYASKLGLPAIGTSRGYTYSKW